jgi:gluconolactonase
LSRDAQGRLLVCMHGDRRIARWEKGVFTTLANEFEGKKFNSPNDLAVRKNGDIYFTDPPYGLDKGNESPLKEQPFNGVYRVTPGGQVSVISRDINWPNGIAFSPDEKILYVAVSDGARPRVMAHDVQPDGSVVNPRVFFDATPLKNKGLKGSCDGMKVDRDGNIWTTGPGGVLILSPEGKLLGTILTNQPTGNCCWGDDGSTLYVTANMFLVRVKTLTKGAGW